MSGLPTVTKNGIPLINESGIPALCTPEGCCKEKCCKAIAIVFSEDQCDFVFRSYSTACPGEVIQDSDNVWDFGDGATGTGAQVSHSYAQSGTYTVTLTITDSAGCTDTTTLDVSPMCGCVGAVPIAEFTAAKAGNPCTIQFIDQTIPGDNPIVSWLWLFGTGTSTNQNPTFAFPGVGPFSVVLQVTDSAGCISQVTHWVECTVQCCPMCEPQFITRIEWKIPTFTGPGAPCGGVCSGICESQHVYEILTGTCGGFDTVTVPDRMKTGAGINSFGGPCVVNARISLFGSAGSGVVQWQLVLPAGVSCFGTHQVPFLSEVAPSCGTMVGTFAEVTFS